MAGRNAAREALGAAERPVMVCDTSACKNAALIAVGDRVLCLDCTQQQNHAEAEAFCKARGLDSIDKKRDFCKKLSRSLFREPTFDRWARNIKQEAVDYLVRCNGKFDLQALERLRMAGAIDGRNKVIPADARAVAAEAYRRERARQIAAAQEHLAKLASESQEPA